MNSRIDTHADRMRSFVGKLPRASRGFTLIEIILVLALAVLLATLLLPGVSSMLSGMSESEPDRLFWSAVGSSREQALTTKRVVVLRFDRETNRLISNVGGSERNTVFAPGVTVQFIRGQSDSAVLIGGQLIDTNVIPLVRFYPDGTCDAFKAQILQPPGRPLLLQIDQWTCAPVIDPKS